MEVLTQLIQNRKLIFTVSVILMIFDYMHSPLIIVKR